MITARITALFVILTLLMSSFAIAETQAASTVTTQATQTNLDNYADVCQGYDDKLPANVKKTDVKSSTTKPTVCDNGVDLVMIGYCKPDPEKSNTNWYYACPLPPPVEANPIQTQDDTQNNYPQPEKQEQPKDDQPSWWMPIILGAVIGPLAAGLISKFMNPQSPVGPEYNPNAARQAELQKRQQQEQQMRDTMQKQDQPQTYTVKDVKGCELATKGIDYNTPYTEITTKELCKKKTCEARFTEKEYKKLGLRCCKEMYGGMQTAQTDPQQPPAEDKDFVKGSKEAFDRVCAPKKLCEVNTDNFNKQWREAVKQYNEDPNLKTCQSMCTAGAPNADTFCTGVAKTHQQRFNGILKEAEKKDKEAELAGVTAGNAFFKVTTDTKEASSVPVPELKDWAKNTNNPESILSLNPEQVQEFNKNPELKKVLDDRIASVFDYTRMMDGLKQANGNKLSDQALNQKAAEYYNQMQAKGFSNYDPVTQKALIMGSLTTGAKDTTGKPLTFGNQKMHDELAARVSQRGTTTPATQPAAPQPPAGGTTTPPAQPTK